MLSVSQEGLMRRAGWLRSSSVSVGAKHEPFAFLLWPPRTAQRFCTKMYVRVFKVAGFSI